MNNYLNIHQIRSKNLKKILLDKYDDVNSVLAEKLEVESSYLSRLYSTGKQRRNIGESLARRIEQVSGVPKNWMDQSQVNGD